jgi:hypothetical protein
MEPSNDDKVLLDVYLKLKREKDLIQGAKAMRQSTSNMLVQQKCDTTIREAERNISYLEETMKQLRLRKGPSVTSNTSSVGTSSSTVASSHQHNVSDSSTMSSASSDSSAPPAPPPKAGLGPSPSETTISKPGEF